MTTSFRVLFDHGTAFVVGPKAEARRRIAACGDAAPIWVRRREAWATSPAVASRVLDQLEGRQIPTVVENSDQAELTFSESVPANSDLTPEGLW